jgi:GGDEF domain-containing protein
MFLRRDRPPAAATVADCHICCDDDAPFAAAGIAERLIGLLEMPFTVDRHDAFMSASIGIAAHRGSASDLLRDADVAMYSAKVSGKGHYEAFDPKTCAEAEARLELSGSLE